MSDNEADIQSLDSISNKIWITMRARIRAEKRLIRNDFHGQLLVLWYSFFGVAVSIYYLVFNAQSKYINVSWVVYSISILVVSTFLSSANFKRRSEQMKQCHLALADLYERIKCRVITEPQKILQNYIEILKISENHIISDYLIAIWSAKLLGETIIGKNLTKCFRTAVIFYWVFRSLKLIIFYLFPIFLAFFLRRIHWVSMI